MAVAPEPLLVAVGLIIVSAFFANLAFRAFRIPDIILLIGLGALLGPSLHWVDVELFRSLAPFVGTVALIVILFEGGLKIHKGELASGVAAGALLAFVVFVVTALLAALVVRVVTGLDLERSLLLGMALGGAGVVIVIPLIQEMDVSSRARTIVSIEAAFSDVLVVLGVVGLSTGIALQQTHPGEFAVRLAQNFSIGIFLGIGASLLWVLALKTFHERSYEYVLTMAILFLLYVGTEFLEGSGPLAVLCFGLVVGNSRKTRRIIAGEGEPAPRARRRAWEWAPVFGGELLTVQHEVVFFLRAFFFVTLGVLLDPQDFSSPRFLVGGFLLALAVVAARAGSVWMLFSRSSLSSWDRLAVALMFPLGLAAAVVSLQPSQRFQIPDTETFGSYAAVTIVLTNFLSALLVFIVSRPRLRARFA